MATRRGRYFPPLSVEATTKLMLDTFEAMKGLGHDPLGERPVTNEDVAERGDYGVLRCRTCHRVAFIEMVPTTDAGYAWGGALDNGRCPGHKVRRVKETFTTERT